MQKKKIKNFTLLVMALLIASACGVKGDPDSVNEKQQQVGYQKYDMIKRKYGDGNITSF